MVLLVVRNIHYNYILKPGYKNEQESLMSIKCQVQISYLDWSRFIFFNWIFCNLDQSRFEIFN